MKAKHSSQGLCSLSLAAPEFGPRKTLRNLNRQRDGGYDDDPGETYAIICNLGSGRLIASRKDSAFAWEPVEIDAEICLKLARKSG